MKPETKGIRTRMGLDSTLPPVLVQFYLAQLHIPVVDVKRTVPKEERRRKGRE